MESTNFVLTYTITMSFLSTEARRGRQEKAPLLGSGSDGDDMPSEAQEHSDVSSEKSSLATSTHGEQEPSIPRTLNLEFGSVASPLPPTPGLQADNGPKILEAFEDLMSKRSVYRDTKSIYGTIVDEINSLARQYNEEQEKAPIRPPKGTWFHAERKQFDRKKAEHEEKLKFILRLRQAMIDDDETKARQQLAEARDAVKEAQAKLDALRRGKKLSKA
ncbi:hypothetical protein CONLIGDRAFT_690592 [Coniochaeta ligniaria NRRL 30616]|uniref:Uncharacterized protein n=1 Tax=Coniochaeta ligniaria NRRL 30616 TaxID=1408157 RepID=A0A1J7IB76_9PEZI|nr:hypothetical protein CONLIGDRAFT_690592 [Coniochaeta ligniaria NRRL 30616]